MPAIKFDAQDVRYLSEAKISDFRARLDMLKEKLAIMQYLREHMVYLHNEVVRLENAGKESTDEYDRTLREESYFEMLAQEMLEKARNNWLGLFEDHPFEDRPFEDHPFEDHPFEDHPFEDRRCL